MLDGGILCFPALWKLREKINKPLSRIHRPVKVYDTRVTRSVQRMFKNKQPTLESKLVFIPDPELFFSSVRKVFTHLIKIFDGDFWVRVERQTLMRLPNTESIIFGIHTYVVKKDNLQNKQITSLKQFKSK